MNFLDNRLPGRFWNKVTPEPNSGCWIWTASTSGGYGQIKIAGQRRQIGAHRLTFETANGTIPDGLEIDHRACRNRLCCNPAHLEAVTSAENARRAVAVRRVVTHCKHGHEFTEANTYASSRGKRECRECRRRIDRVRDATPARMRRAR